MAWHRLLSVIAVAVVGLGGAYLVLSDPNAARWTIALSGVLGLAGIAAAVVLLAFAAYVIAEDVRPRFYARTPLLPMMLTTELGAFVGTRRFQTHPVRFWLGMVLNSRVYIGVLIFDKPEELTLFRDAPPTPQPGDGDE